MAHVEDRWEKLVGGRKVRTDRYGRGDRWRARYLDPAGRERSQTFARKLDAERFLATVETDKLRGAYLDPQAGRPAGSPWTTSTQSGRNVSCGRPTPARR